MDYYNNMFHYFLLKTSLMSFGFDLSYKGMKLLLFNDVVKSSGVSILNEYPEYGIAIIIVLVLKSYDTLNKLTLKAFVTDLIFVCNSIAKSGPV